MSDTTEFAGVILAAGASTRMGASKALLLAAGEPFAVRLSRTLGTICREVVVVSSAAQAEALDRALSGRARVVVNPAPERGMLSSLQCGLASVAHAGAVLFTPVDMPLIRPATIVALADSFPGMEALAPEYKGAHGHPVCISREIAAMLLALPLTAQARDVLRPRMRYIAVDDPGVARDIDTPEEYQRMLAEGAAAR